MLCIKKLKIKLDFLKEIKKYIEYNDQALIADKLKVSRQMISEVLNGKSVSARTLKGIISYLSETEKITKEKEQEFLMKAGV